MLYPLQPCLLRLMLESQGSNLMLPLHLLVKKKIPWKTTNARRKEINPKWLRRDTEFANPNLLPHFNFHLAI